MKFADEFGKAKELALKLGSTAADTLDLATEVGENTPWVGPALKTLSAIRRKVSEVSENRKKLEALRDRYDFLTMYVVVKWCNSGLNIGRLLQVLTEVETLVVKCAIHRRRDEVLQGTAVHTEIDALNAELYRVALDMGLMGVADMLSRIELMQQDRAQRDEVQARRTTQFISKVESAIRMFGPTQGRAHAPRLPPLRSYSEGQRSAGETVPSSETPGKSTTSETGTGSLDKQREIPDGHSDQMEVLSYEVDNIRHGMDNLANMMQAILVKLSAADHPYPELVDFLPAPRKKGFVKNFLAGRAFVDEMRLVFRCRYDLSVIPCGLMGEGYHVNVRRRSKILPLAQVSLVQIRAERPTPLGPYIRCGSVWALSEHLVEARLA